jgi:F0F1-type ATP synthase membrane subunit b/b'
LSAEREIESRRRENEEKMTEMAIAAAAKFMEDRLDKDSDKRLIEKIISDLK